MTIKSGHNKALQGTGGQRGFSKVSLAAQISGKLKLHAANPASP